MKIGGEDEAKGSSQKVRIMSMLVCILLFAYYVPAPAQQPGRIFRVGYLDLGTASGGAVLVDAFRSELVKLGWVEGKNIVIEYRFGNGKPERLAGLATELVQFNVDVIVGTSTAPESAQLQVQPVVVKGPEEFESAFSAMARERAGAVIVQPLFAGVLGVAGPIAELAIKNRVPTISDGLRFADAGGLIYYGPDQLALWRRIPIYVDKILKGAKPGELPVEQPSKFELMINLKTAEQIGLTIPPNVLARADSVIR
jgi:ABC-type uncharacterized transport system substrate-binding protein